MSGGNRMEGLIIEVVWWVVARGFRAVVGAGCR